MIRPKFPGKEFLRQGHKKRHTAKDQDYEKRDLPRDLGRVQQVAKNEMEENAGNRDERNVVWLAVTSTKCSIAFTSS